MGGKDACRLYQVGNTLLLNKPANEEHVWRIGRCLTLERGIDVDTQPDCPDLICRKSSRDQLVADELRHADKQRSLALQGRKPSLENRWDDVPGVVFVLGRVTTVKSYRQRDTQRPRDRQCQGTASTKLGVHDARPQLMEIGLRREHAELLEAEAIQAAKGTGPTENQWLHTEV